ncbi:phage antirepressor [Metaclostridioides mangenotii]|uniref:phage antirepressor n=1 Tax=Metaclostridioides mangenotii TaxID=1540 RepID=UPI0004B9C058|nr:phage antirepressor [Clostridioides mangenotii]
MESINANNVVNILSPCENTDNVFETGTKEIQVFSHTEFGEIRALDLNGEPWLVAKDFSERLGYKEPHKAVVKHVDEDDRAKHPITDNLGRTQETWIINESGMFSLVLGSKLPSAKKFKKWVTSDVLPSIRKHGGYLTPNKIRESLADPNTLIELLTVLKEEQDKRIELEVINKDNEPKVKYANVVQVSESTISVGQLAKMICRHGVNLGRNKLFEWMRDNGYLIRAKSRDWNLPTQKSMGLGVLEVDQNGEYVLYKTPVVTGKGQVYFVNKILDEYAPCSEGLM